MFNLKTTLDILKMSRKSRNNKNNNKTQVANTESTQQTEESLRFLQCNPVEDIATSETIAFSVGANEVPVIPIPKPKSTSIWSRLFGSSKKERKESVSSVASFTSFAPVSSQRSFWQRSKSILRPRSNFDRNQSVFIDLPHLKIVGSGSAAQLLNYEDKCEFTIDYYGMLEHIFEENEAFYRGDEWNCAEYAQVAQINEDGLVSPASTTSDVEAVDNCFECVATFSDNPKLDSPLLPDEEVECFQDCSLSEQQSSCNYAENQSSSEYSELSGSSLSMESAIRSLINGKYSLEGLRSYSTDEVAQMFGLMSVDDRPPQSFPDGSVRCLVEGENGSLESIRFQNCWKPQSQQQTLTRSEDNLKLTEIHTNEVPQKQVSLKQRCQSLAHFSKTYKADSPTDLAASRRRSLGAKVSQIVAMYENVALQ